MATLTISSPGQAYAGTSYAENVARAARGLLAAILAITPESRATPAKESRYRSVLSLYRLADSYEASMPSLAQELRAIASRS